MNLLAAGLIVSVLHAAPQDPKRFIDEVNRQLKVLTQRSQATDWIRENFITYDTEQIDSFMQSEIMGYQANATLEAMKFKKSQLDPVTAREIYLLRTGTDLPGPSSPKLRDQLSLAAAQLDSMYGAMKGCDAQGHCQDLLQLEDVLAKNRDYDAQLGAWQIWHDAATPTRPLFLKVVALGNKGAQEIGFHDLGDFWRARYDETPAQFEKEIDGVWAQLKPFYQQLHCYTRAKLGQRYGVERVPPDGLIPAHLLGNMWAQEWNNIYPLLEPYPGASDIDVTAALQRQGYEAHKMVKLAESFFVSLGLDPLPQTFWERSLFTKPADRDVVCHASAWDVWLDNDLRLKACLKPTDEDLITAHHELGHLYYYHAYDHLPVLFQKGANDGFHEAIGDTIALSVTPQHLKDIGLLTSAQRSQQALLNFQMMKALDKVAFLPFGLVMDAWRWRVFSGQIPPDKLNSTWWELSRQYQGIAPPTPRTDAQFDPGAKFHIDSFTPYVRYFLAAVLQFQFHKGLCEAAGFKGPLYECSIYGSKEAGRRLETMLAMGATRPWPDALKVITGQTRLDAGPMLEYFQPLRSWLEEQNRGRQCGW